MNYYGSVGCLSTDEIIYVDAKLNEKLFREIEGRERLSKKTKSRGVEDKSWTSTNLQAFCYNVN